MIRDARPNVINLHRSTDSTSTHSGDACPSFARAYLGVPSPEGSYIPCGLLRGHQGHHTFSMTWADK